MNQKKFKPFNIRVEDEDMLRYLTALIGATDTAIDEYLQWDSSELYDKLAAKYENKSEMWELCSGIDVLLKSEK